MLGKSSQRKKMQELNYKKEYPMQYELKEQDQMQEGKRYIWHEHFYTVVGLKRVVLAEELRTEKIMLLTNGWKSSLFKPTSTLTRDEWQVLKKYTINEFITAIREYLDVVRELLQSNDLLENEKLGLSQITWDDYDEPETPNKKKWRQEEMFEEWKEYKKPDIERWIK